MVPGPSCSPGTLRKLQNLGCGFVSLCALPAPSPPYPRPGLENSPQSPAPGPRGSPRPLEFAAGTSARALSCPSGQVAVPLRVPFGALSISCSGYKELPETKTLSEK